MRWAVLKRDRDIGNCNLELFSCVFVCIYQQNYTHVHPPSSVRQFRHYPGFLGGLRGGNLPPENGFAPLCFSQFSNLCLLAPTCPPSISRNIGKIEK